MVSQVYLSSEPHLSSNSHDGLRNKMSGPKRPVEAFKNPSPFDHSEIGASPCAAPSQTVSHRLYLSLNDGLYSQQSWSHVQLIWHFSLSKIRLYLGHHFVNKWAILIATFSYLNASLSPTLFYLPVSHLDGPLGFLLLGDELSLLSSLPVSSAVGLGLSQALSVLPLHVS